MSESGQKQKLRYFTAMSALPLKADIRQDNAYVCLVPQTDSRTAAKLFNYLVGTGEQRRWE